jgi:hypothetical protein
LTSKVQQTLYVQVICSLQIQHNYFRITIESQLIAYTSQYEKLLTAIRVSARDLTNWHRSVDISLNLVDVSMPFSSF